MRFRVKIKIWQEKSVPLFRESKYFKLTTIQVRKSVTVTKYCDASTCWVQIIFKAVNFCFRVDNLFLEHVTTFPSSVSFYPKIETKCTNSDFDILFVTSLKWHLFANSTIKLNSCCVMCIKKINIYVIHKEICVYF